MDFDLSTEQKLIQDSARSMMERDVQPILDKHDPNKSLPKAAMLEIFSHLNHLCISQLRHALIILTITVSNTELVFQPINFSFLRFILISK